MAIGGLKRDQKDTSTQSPDDEDMLYKHLSPEAFFSMKDKQPPMPMGHGMGPMGPGMGPRGPGMGPIGPGMGPMGPGTGPGMGSMGPGMGPMRPGMGPKGLKMPIGPDRPMGPMKPGMRPLKKPMGPANRPEMRPMTPEMDDPEGQGIGQKGYEHFDISVLDDMARQSKQVYIENYAAEYQIDNKGDDLLIYNLCFALSYIWRRGRQSIRKYFHLRDLYHNHLPFEVGYLSHVIMIKYQNMLELYEYCVSLGQKRRPALTTLHLVHFQKSLMQDAVTIEHLCNMLHEIKSKYAVQPYDPGNRFDIPPPTNATIGTTTITMEKMDDNIPRHGARGHTALDKAYLAKRIEESHKIIHKTMAERQKKLKAAREFYKKHGYLPTTTRSQQPMRLWSPNLDYGWSGEEDW